VAHRVAWSAEARADLRRIAEFVAQDSPSYASTIVDAVLARVARLGEFPRMGRVVPELEDESFRELLVYSYRVMYRLEGDSVIVAAVIHVKRSLGLPE
jgi:toxin ParE1/3/4